VLIYNAFAGPLTQVVLIGYQSQKENLVLTAVLLSLFYNGSETFIPISNC
jgi:hypothetical protein